MLPPLTLYLHWPFCARKCPYCDFNSHVRASVDQGRWRAALLTELDHAARLTQGRRVEAVFFGGGTPSLMPPETVAALLQAIRRHWPVAADLEISLEANPTSIEAETFPDLAAAGINRFSLGVQALNDADLTFLGRTHGAAEALAALRRAQAAASRVSLDLIYARPGQSLQAWEAELAEALALGTGHLSLYQLTIEEGTRFHSLWQRGELRLPEEDLAAEMYERTLEMTEAAGLPAYEVSNHARPGQECRHNWLGWQGADYAGIGPGAHGRLTLAEGLVATRAHRAPEVWLDLVERQGHGWTEITPVATGEEVAIERLLTGLRTRAGVDLAALSARTSRPVEALIDAGMRDALVETGDLLWQPPRLQVTPQGWLRLNAILAALLVRRERAAER